jgi:hypothetical protein
MQLADDGLWVTAEMSERGSAVLRENPQLGVSARIVEQYSRSDGAFFPAAIQHVLATLDPRIPGLGAWQAVEMANAPGLVIDLSAARFPGEDGGLSAAELADLEQVMAEVDAELGGGELSDAELEAIIAAAEADAGPAADFSEFDAAFNARVQADLAREDARAAALVEDVMHPARRDEDRMARLMRRAADGLYDEQQLSFASEAGAVELAVTTGRGLCSVPDEFGRCSARYHNLECAHGQGVDWMAAGPPRATYAASLANLSAGIELAGGPSYGDPDDGGQHPIPQSTITLAHELASDWGLLDDAPGAPSLTASMDLLRPDTGPLSGYDSLAEPIGAPLRDGLPSVPGYPGIRELAQDLGLRSASPSSRRPRSTWSTGPGPAPGQAQARRRCLPPQRPRPRLSPL